MQPHYTRAYRELYERHWWWRARERAVLSVLARGHVAHPGDHVLDVGCGDGLLFRHLAQYGEVEGIEPEPQSVSPDGPYASQIHIRPFDASFMPAHRFRLIVMLDVLEHMTDAAGALAHVRHLLDEDGTLVITVPALRCLWTSHDDLNNHVTRYTRQELQAAITTAGLHVVEMHYLFHWMTVAKLVVRLREWLCGPSSALPSIPARPVNVVLGAITTLDLRGGRGWGLPFGSSLIAVARHQSPASAA